MTTPLWILLVVTAGIAGWAFGYDFGFCLGREQKKIDEEKASYARPPETVEDPPAPPWVLDAMLDG